MCARARGQELGLHRLCSTVAHGSKGRTEGCAAYAGDIVPMASKATSGDKGKFEASVKGFVIGAVPDRGGRPTEGRAAQAAANMPQWKPRSAAGTCLTVCTLTVLL